MTDQTNCSTCGTKLPEDAPEGACPHCLLAAGLDGEDEVEPAEAPATVEEVAAVFPDYEVLELVGKGGMGAVYKARQKSLDRLVALKILTVRGEDAPAFAERFAREGRALARLDHPNVVDVFECGERDGVYFLSMEFVDGPTLRELMRAGDLTPEQAVAIVPQICDALQYAHDQGVVHRDIKPENVLLDKSGVVKIADFGLAKMTSGALPEVTLTRVGQVMGTLHYMAPEQIETPLTVDHRADIYSLGVIFYEMLTGELPLGRFDAPSERVQMDVRLDEVVLRALAKQRDRRYQSAAAVRTEVDAISSTEAPAIVAAAVPTESRLCKKALFGMLAIPASIVVAMLLTLVMPSLGGWWAGAIELALLPVALGFAGIVLSIWGWIEIARSKGALHGTWMAVVGTFAPFLCVPLPGILFLFMARVEPMETTEPGVPIVPAPQFPTDATPPAPVPDDDLVFADRPDVSRQTMEEILALWEALRIDDGSEPSEIRIGRVDRETLLNPAIRPLLTAEPGTPVLQALFTPFPRPIAEFENPRLRFTEDGAVCELRVSHLDDHVLGFRFYQHGGKWYLSGKWSLRISPPR